MIKFPMSMVSIRVHVPVERIATLFPELVHGDVMVELKELAAGEYGWADAGDLAWALWPEEE